MGVTLYPDQQERFIAPIRAAFGSGAQSVLGVLPTGGGKTVCFSYMAAGSLAKNKTVGILAHRIEILDQISRTLDPFGVAHGFIAPGRSIDPLAGCQVCSSASLGKRMDRLRKKPFDFLIIDEAHHCAAGTVYAQIAAIHMEAGSRILGVTATPRRLSGEPLSSFQQMVIGPSTKELIALGRLSRYKAFAPVTPDMGDVKRSRGDFDFRQTEEKMDRPTVTGDAVREYKNRVMGKRALVFCVSVAHAMHVAQQFSAAGIPAASIDGKMDRFTRARILADFEAGRILVLTSADLISEGFDVPAIEAAFLLRPTDSLIIYLQQVGRALRVYPGKEFAYIFDHAGNIARHGLPDDDREWSLEGAKKVGGMKLRDPILPTKVCGACFGVFRAGPSRCPYCNGVIETEGRSIKEVAGDLAEVDLDQMRAKFDRERAVREAYTTDDLAKVAVLYNYKARWVLNMQMVRKKKVPHISEVVELMSRHRERMRAIA